MLAIQSIGLYTKRRHVCKRHRFCVGIISPPRRSRLRSDRAAQLAAQLAAQRAARQPATQLQAAAAQKAAVARSRAPMSADDAAGRTVEIMPPLELDGTTGRATNGARPAGQISNGSPLGHLVRRLTQGRLE